MRRGDLVSLGGYSGRKVGFYVGGDESRARVCVWRHNSRRWSQPMWISTSLVSPAPAEWPMTRAAAEAVRDDGVPA